MPDNEPAMPLPLILKACPDLATYAPAEPRTWRDLVALADQVRGYMGITATGWSEARARMGPAVAPATLAVMLQRFAAVRNPGAYLHRLVEQHGAERLNLSGMTFGLLGQREKALV